MHFPVKRLEISPLLVVLARPTLRDASLVFALVVLTSLCAGAVRTSPLLLAPSVPFSLSLPFARSLLLVSLEVALFVAPSIGAAIASARMVDRGEARALFAIGASPRSLVAYAAPLWLGFALASFAASLAWGRQAEAPGLLLSSLIEQGKHACEASAKADPEVPHAATVPLAQATWICLPHERARLVFDALALGDARAHASGIELSADTSKLTAHDLVFVVPETQDRPGQTLRVKRASLAGLWPMSRPSNLRSWPRATLLAFTSSLTALFTSFLVFRMLSVSRVLSLALGIAGPGVALLAFSSLERSPSPLWAYAIVPVAALFAPFLAAKIQALRARELRV